MAVLGWPAGAGAGPAADELAQRTPEVQREILAIEVRSAGNRCAAVERIFYNGEFNHADFYSVFCPDSGSYMVEMRFRGQLTGRAAACASYMRDVGLRCWRTF